MNLIHTIILSIVEGITEFLPISSTGHMILASKLLNIPQTEFIKSFEIIIQLGAILAVVVIYFKKLVLSLNRELYKKIIIAFVPTGIFGLFLYKYVKSYLIGNSLIVVLSLFVGGIVMLLFEKYFKNRNQKITYKSYFVIGLFQVLSMIPGVSRAFATIFGGMVVGMKKEESTEFSFLLAIPTMAAASGLDLIKTDLSVWTNSNIVTLLLGFVISFITAYIVVKWLIKFVQSHNFNIFGWYRIILALLFMAFII
jgi:undecaprenyl-diphosphatase